MVSEKVRRLQKRPSYLYVIRFTQAHEQGSKGQFTQPTLENKWCKSILEARLSPWLVLCIVLLQQGYSDFYFVFTSYSFPEAQWYFQTPEASEGCMPTKSEDGAGRTTVTPASSVTFAAFRSPSSPDRSSLSETVVPPVMNWALPGEEPTTPMPRQVWLYKHVSGASTKS